MRRRPAVVVLVLSLVAVLVSVGLGVGAGALAGGTDNPQAFARPAYPSDTTSLPTIVSDVSESPSGRSILLTDGAVGVFSTGYVVFAADSDRVRLVSAVDDRSDSEYGAVTYQLSPDGSRLAVGDATGRFDDVLVVDLTTGASRRYPIEPGPNDTVDVLAWSADGTRLAVATWGLNVIDVDSGAVTMVASPGTAAPRKTELLPGEQPMPDGSQAQEKEPGTVAGVQAAFSPDGRSIAYDDGIDIEIYPIGGKGKPTLLTDQNVWLAGPAAWSPDGKRVLVTRDDATSAADATSLLAIDVATRTATRMVTFDYLDFSMPTPVGWRGPDEVLLSGADADSVLVVDGYGLDGERHERILTFDYSTSSVQFATGLIGSAVSRDGGFSGGPTPAWWRVTVGSVVGVGAALVFLIVGLAVGIPLAVRRRAAARRVSAVALAGLSFPPSHLRPPGGFAVPGAGSVGPGPVAGPGVGVGSGAAAGPVGSAGRSETASDWALPR